MSFPCIDVFSVPLPLVRRQIAVVKLGAGEGGHTATMVGDAAQPEQTRKRRSIPRNKVLAGSEDQEEANAVKYLSEALEVEEEVAKGLSSRGLQKGKDYPLKEENCRGWVGYLNQLADGDMSFVKTSIFITPLLLRYTFDEGRIIDLRKLESYLNLKLQLSKEDMMKMAVKNPLFLVARADTVQAMVEFLLQNGSGDVLALRKELVSHPQVLASSVPAVQVKLSWLTEKIGLTSHDALKCWFKLFNYSIDATLEPHRLWMLDQGFLEEEVARIVKSCPQLLHLDVAKLGNRLDYFAKKCSIDARVVCQLITGHPALWTLDLEGELVQLKLQYWTRVMGYSFTDLQHAPQAIMSSISRLAVRHAAVYDLLGLHLTAQQFVTALIRGSNDTTTGFAPYYIPMHMRAAVSVLKGDTVQDILRPLAARLCDPNSQRQWHEALDATPPTSAEVRSTPEHRQLYSQLYSIFEEDWWKSSTGVEVLRCEKAVKDADDRRRKGVYSAKAASQVEKKEEGQRTTRGRHAISKSSKGSS